MHFQNPRSTIDAAKVKICQLPEMVCRTARGNEIFAPSKKGPAKEVSTFEIYENPANNYLFRLNFLRIQY